MIHDDSFFFPLMFSHLFFQGFRQCSNLHRIQSRYPKLRITSEVKTTWTPSALIQLLHAAAQLIFSLAFPSLRCRHLRHSHWLKRYHCRHGGCLHFSCVLCDRINRGCFGRLGLGLLSFGRPGGILGFFVGRGLFFLRHRPEGRGARRGTFPSWHTAMLRQPEATTVAANVTGILDEALGSFR